MSCDTCDLYTMKRRRLNFFNTYILRCSYRSRSRDKIQNTTDILQKNNKNKYSLTWITVQTDKNTQSKQCVDSGMMCVTREPQQVKPDREKGTRTEKHKGFRDPYTNFCKWLSNFVSFAVNKYSNGKATR